LLIDEIYYVLECDIPLFELKKKRKYYSFQVLQKNNTSNAMSLMNLECSSIPDSIKYYRTDEQTSEFEVSI
jgi:hypothetical protein